MISSSPCQTGQKPVVIQPALVAKDVTFVAAPANDSAFRRRRYAISALSVPCVRAPSPRPAAERPSAPMLSAMPFALADAWTSAHLTLWGRYVEDSFNRPLDTLTGSSLARLMVGSATVNAALATACVESLAGLGGAAP